jgi:hypothetical protein
VGLLKPVHPILVRREKGVLSRVTYHGDTSHFFGIGISRYVSDTAGIGIFRSVLLYCKIWREHLFKILRELFQIEGKI